MKKQGVATLVVSHDPKRERNWCTESSVQQSTEFALALATMKALEISVSTRNVEEVAAVRLTCRFWTPRLVGIVAIIALTLASMLYVIRMYHPGNLSIVRVANLFATLIIALALSLAFRGLRVLRAAFTGNLRAKPFSRKDDEGLLSELFKTNGKYFLWKIYVGEVLEMLYQVANYTLYSCVIHDTSLLLYNIVMLSGTSHTHTHSHPPTLPHSHAHTNLHTLTLTQYQSVSIWANRLFVETVETTLPFDAITTDLEEHVEQDIQGAESRGHGPSC